MLLRKRETEQWNGTMYRIIGLLLLLSLSGCGVVRAYQAQSECRQGNQSSCHEVDVFVSTINRNNAIIEQSNRDLEERNYRRQVLEQRNRISCTTRTNDIYTYTNCN